LKKIRGHQKKKMANGSSNHGTNPDSSRDQKQSLLANIAINAFKNPDERELLEENEDGEVVRTKPDEPEQVKIPTEITDVRNERSVKSEMPEG